MTNLRGGSMLALLPSAYSQDMETQAFAYAVDRQIDKLCGYADGTQVYASVDKMPDQILDILAVENRTPAYSQGYSLAVKVDLLRQTIPFWAQMGTPYAVNRMISTIFGSGYIEESWEYGGEPHHFRAMTGNPYITKENVDDFVRAVAAVKRLSSWLDEVALGTSAETFCSYIGFWVNGGEIVRTQPATL